jgi:transcription elongation factor Elf1
MSVRAARNEFGCIRCGSPAVAVPAFQDLDALVCCGRCGADLGSWKAFLSRACEIISSDARDRAVDPQHVSSDLVRSAPREAVS